MMVTKLRCVLMLTLLGAVGCGRDVAKEMAADHAVETEVFLLHSISTAEQRKKLLQKHSSEEVASWSGDRLLRELKAQ